MASIDRQFLNDLEQCLKVADQLGEVDTEETRLFVSQQLQDLHNFLQEKQRDVSQKSLSFFYRIVSVGHGGLHSIAACRFFMFIQERIDWL